MTYVGAEPFIVDTWVMDTLLANTALGAMVNGNIFNFFAPPQTLFPYIVFQQQSMRDVRGVGPARIMVDTLYVVRGVGQGSDFATLAAVAREIDLSLSTPVGGAVLGGAVFNSVREEPFTLVEVEDGKQFRHLGGSYRIHAQAT